MSHPSSFIIQIGDIVLNCSQLNRDMYNVSILGSDTELYGCTIIADERDNCFEDCKYELNACRVECTNDDYEECNDLCEELHEICKSEC